MERGSTGMSFRVGGLPEEVSNEQNGRPKTKRNVVSTRRLVR